MKPVLLIDCGNTQTKFGVWQAKSVQQNFAISNQQIYSESFDLRKELHKKNINDAAFEGVVMASVVPQSTKIIQQYLSHPIYTVDHAHCGGLIITLPHPYEVGADRLVNAYAALELYGTSQIVIDFGTATTLDLIDKNGAYAGGIILPGIDLTRRTLHDATAKLPLIELTRPEKVLGTSTAGAMNQGLYWGYISMIEGLLHRLKAEQQDDFRCIATGGYASLFAQDCPFIHQVEPELTLLGLGLIADRQWKK